MRATATPTCRSTGSSAGLRRRAAQARRRGCRRRAAARARSAADARRRAGGRRRRRADARRHRAPRRRRPVRQPRVGDAERRLAPELADDPGPRLAARHACADVLARARPALVARPGRRPRTTLSPGLVLRDGAPWLAYGTPGGDSQEQWALHALVRHVDRGLNLQEAIDAPEWHTDHLISSFYPRGFAPRSLTVEKRFGDDVVAGLRRRGHDVSVAAPWSLGRVSAVAREGGELRAAANPREMQGYAVCR